VAGLYEQGKGGMLWLRMEEGVTVMEGAGFMDCIY
jgi:hypothetical protein